MSAVPTELRLEEASPVQRVRGDALPLAAWIYFVAVAAVTSAVAAPLIARIDSEVHGWVAFAALASSAAIAQLFVVRTTRDQSYHTSAAFLIAAALLLPPELVVLMGVVQHVPEWLKHRYAWYIQTFNICNFTLNGLAAWGVVRVLIDGPARNFHHSLTWALAACAACLVFVALNHALMAGMLYLARGHHPRETGLFSTAMLTTELVLAGLGIGIAVFWTENAWLAPFALAPLLLIHRALHVPRLEEQARVDPKTGLFNARHFTAALTEEVTRAERFDRPVSLIMADLDLLREINNANGHLVGDAVLLGVADTFREQLRHYDVPARFGGEEFALLLPETSHEQALEIAERIRRAIAGKAFDVPGGTRPVRVTISMGVASFPQHARDAGELVHHADLAAYRAKLQGRNRVLGAGGGHLHVPADRVPQLAEVPPEQPRARVIDQRRRRIPVAHDRRQTAAPAANEGLGLFALSGRLTVLVAVVVMAGIGAGAAGIALDSSLDVLGMLAVVLLVGAGQALALELDDGSISVGAVGAIAGAALFGFRTALAIALASALVDWSARRIPFQQVFFNVGALSLAATGAAGVFALADTFAYATWFLVVGAAAAGIAYYGVNMGLLSLAIAAENFERPLVVWRERFLWLLPHYAAYGLVAGVLAIAYEAVGLLALAAAVVPLLLMRKTQAAYISHTERASRQLREAAETIHSQNISLEQANRLLRERSTAAMESLSATVDARDAYTAGHSRRVRHLSLAIGRKLGLTHTELELLGYGALFHDIGKLAIPDAVLLKPDKLDGSEWELMRRHAEEGARIVDRLGFLSDAVPAIRHHHERYDGRGYPDGLTGEEIPLGARIIHVADALDSMLTSRVYQPALSEEEAIQELRRGVETQFCPRCVRALAQALGVGTSSLELLQAS